ncbi:uncharacterized protein LOC117106359 [Anneissia japonica]|uniref:uncharacterized protein LOC117106359 n=1 Tax=Anneissia japonica TaxID=1529436 RepID=UPI001425AF65|nr:uncharacterized protein LOC117106359 [Anneissia japonica]XP_033103621.1 uncharacterized protein LOC117106359 [Anneissia japonica]XP_033103622.1 uncharacterized protein LOC117106359 [Anneissia japonica]XP_033103623.1 uncharacterized protein LOC117106359 [Anneissia japonica]XP_033103624.1 uncharacterized protein LOC117106359 [Anneissia japonica]XP_033103625.1 uncharacterized protein LOC117106359 [Anneissia japonica]
MLCWTWGLKAPFVRSEFASKLGIKGKEVAVSITKVGGSEETFYTRLFDLKLCGKNRDVIHSIQALEMEKINEVEKVNVEDLERSFKMQNAFKRSGGLIDIVIGVDHAHLMTAETKKSRGLVALNSPLGWAVFGGKAGDGMMSRVMNVMINKPVNLDDFRKVESMGVDVGKFDCNAKLNAMEDMEAKVIEDSSGRKPMAYSVSMG